MEDVGVVYSTKELLERIDHRFERLESLVTGVVQRPEFETVEQRVLVLEQEAVGTKKIAAALAADRTERFTVKQKAVGAIFALLTLALNTLALAPDILG